MALDLSVSRGLTPTASMQSNVGLSDGVLTIGLVAPCSS
jgi:hypothetical protein